MSINDDLIAKFKQKDKEVIDLSLDEENNTYQVPATANGNKDVALATEAHEDVEKVKQSMRDVIDVGTKAVHEMHGVAQATDHPRAYEVLSTLIRTVVDGNKTLHDIHTGKKGTVPDPDKGAQYIYNDHREQNSVLMDTASLLKEANKKGKEDS